MSSQLVELYAQNCQSEHTARNARYRLLQFADWLEREHGVTELEAVMVQHVLAYKTHLAKTDLAATSQARILETIRSFFRWCHAEGMIPTDPARNVKSPRAIQNREPSYLETEDMRRLFDLVGQSRHAARDRAILHVLSLGLRVGEVVGLNVGDVMPDNGAGVAWLSVHGKRSYERTIPLSPPAYAAIRSYLAERGEAAQDAPLFPSQRDSRMSRSNLQKRFANLCAMAGLAPGKAHCHAARHGAAMRWVYQSTTPGGIYTVARMLGHSSIATTQKYLHVGPQGRAAMVETIRTDPLAV